MTALRYPLVLALALLLGLAMPLAFSPYGFWPLALLAPAGLFFLWLHLPPARAALAGFIFGLGQFCFGVGWLYVSMHRYGNMSAALSMAAVLAVSAYLALYPALLGWWQARRRTDSPQALTVHLLILLPAGWVLLEWLRAWLFSGFPWLNPGYAMVDTPLAGWAPLAGVQGVTFALLVCGGALVLLLRRPRLAPAVMLVLAVCWGVGWWSQSREWTQPAGEPLQVALVQGNVPLEQKWVASQKPLILEHYRTLGARAPEAQLVIWPEAAVPGFSDTLPDAFWLQLEERASRGVTTLFGVLERTGPDTYFNSLVAVTPSGRASYRKAHLVPFGEYLPWKWAFDWLLDYLQIPMSDFSAGSGDQALVPAGATSLGLSICYEDAFGRELLSRLPQAGVLVNVSEDGWFGKSIGPHQRMDMARLRSMETGRPGLRAATTGISAVIDFRGQVQARTRQFEATVLSASVQPRQGSTPFASLGGFAAEFLAVFLLLLSWVIGRRKD